MLMSSINFEHRHGVTQISLLCSDIIRKISRGSEEDSWPCEEDVCFDLSESVFEKPKCSFMLLFTQYWKKTIHHCLNWHNASHPLRGFLETKRLFHL